MQGFHHVAPIEVRFRDLDVFGHVNNAVIFTFVETARLKYLIDVDIRSPQANFQGIAFILAHINFDFLKPIFYQQQVEIGTRVTEIGRSSVRLEHQIEADGEVVVTGHGVLVHYDYRADHSLPIPPDMRAKIEDFERKRF